MSERELLELAAKAAGVGPLDFDYAEREGHGFYMGPRLPMPHGVLMAAMWTYWNPLTDDGDALRLAVKLRLSVSTPHGNYRAFAQSQDRQRGVDANCGDPSLDITDPLAATRRAIVRAAAEIGRAAKGTAGQDGAA
jgi:hypothetical protein